MIKDNKYIPKIAQGNFNKISWHNGQWCFHLTSGKHDLVVNGLVQINFIKDKIEYDYCHYVGEFIDSPDFKMFAIQDDLFLSKKDKSILGITLNKEINIIGVWSKLHDLELSISKCASLLLSLGFKRTSPYYNTLYRIQEARIFKSGKIPMLCTAEYLNRELNIPFEELKKIDLFNIEEMNNLLGNIRRSYVNFDSRVVQFDDSFIILHDEYQHYYFEFLCLLLWNTSIYNIDTVLRYHAKKHSDNDFFCKKLKEYFLDLCIHFNVSNIIKDKIQESIEEQRKLPSYEEKQEAHILQNSKPLLGLTKPETFGDIFAIDDWQKYIKALMNTDPPVLNSQFEFIGSKRLHKGVICSWIKYLSQKGIIKKNINRSQLAIVLNNEIKNFELGIDGKTFDNVSKEFEKNFKKQLTNIIA